MSEEIPSSQLNIIVDLTSSSFFDFKKLHRELPYQLTLNLEHHYWHFGGLRSFTIPFNTTYDEIIINQVFEKLKTLQNPSSPYPPYWISHKQCTPITPTCEVIKKNQRLGRFQTKTNFRVEYTAGALVQLNEYIYDPRTSISDIDRLTFYYDRIDLDYGHEGDLRKTIKSAMMDKCAVIMKDKNQFTIFFNMNGNATDYESLNRDEKQATISYIRTAPRSPQPFYSTIRLVITIIDDNQENQTEHQQDLSRCYNNFLQFFQRNHIHDCFGSIKSSKSEPETCLLISDIIINENLSFIKQYCWQMLLSIGYRFQKRLTDGFLQKFNSIEDDDEFYQTALHIWRRSSEYYFLDLLDELRRYQDKVANLASLTTTKKDEYEHERWSLSNPPKHYAYVPSVTLTPSVICVKPLKLVKTNRVLREPKFGGNIMFSLVDVRDENGTMDLYPHDYRALRWKIETLLESGFDLGCLGRTYRYLHHSQSQLKDKQFWFYYHDGKTNFSFEQAFNWMGDFQDEKIIAKHAARIAQCFTGAEATIQIPQDNVEYIEDIQTDDNKYNFTDGVGTMSTAIRDSINPHRQFSAVQIRYGGCKGVISVNPDLDNSDHQLRIRKSMRKFKCSHDILELCRISKPRPLYLNRQIIVLLSHRQIDDRRFLLLQNDHQKILSESLVYPERAYELLAEKLNRTLFPLRSLIDDAQINLIQEPFFRQLLITTGKFELAQMKERTRLKLPKNQARNMIGIVDEYGILDYGEVFIQYTELTNDYSNNKESEKTIILEQKVVVTKNPCHHPGDIRIFKAIDVPRLRHLKDVIVFPQRGKRPHPNEISGSDLDGDEYAVIWDPAFIPQTPNDIPYDYDSRAPMLRVTDRPVNRTDIQNTVLDISEQSCAGKLCSIHLAYMDRYGVADEKTLSIAGYISEELDAPKTGQHPLTPAQILQLEEQIGNERPDYFDKPYYKMYSSKHVLGQLFRSCLRFEPHWISVQTPPTVVQAAPIDQLLIHDKHQDYRTSVEELARIYRECIMDIMYVYRFSSDVDLLCRFDSSIPQYRAPLSKQQTESACLVADSAQVELRQLIRRIRRLFYDDLHSCDKFNPNYCTNKCSQCLDRKMAKASALYIYCYTDIRHARRMLSLPWLFSSLLIKTRKSNIDKYSKLLSPFHIEQMLKIQPYRLIGQSLLQAIQYFLQMKIPFYFHHTYSNDNPKEITLTFQSSLTSKAKRLWKQQQIALLDYLLIEIFQYYLLPSISKIRSPITDSKPNLIDSIWQHILTRFIFQKCSPLVLVTSTTDDKQQVLTIEDYQFWSDEHAWMTLQRLIQITTECADEHSDKSSDYAHANEYLISILQKMATTGCLFS